MRRSPNPERADSFRIRGSLQSAGALVPERSRVRPSTPPRAGDVVEIACTDLIAKTGQAVGRADGFVVYVLGPLPGERARVRIESVKASYAVAELLVVLERSPERVEPFCEVFGACGGCTVQHLSYRAQLAWKQSLVENGLRRLGGIADAKVGFPIGMRNPRAYRNKMALVVQERGAQRVFGFYAARTHDVVPIETCPVVMPQLDRTLANLTDAACDPATRDALAGARHVIARTGRASAETIVSITTESASPALASLGSQLAAKLPGTIGISNSFAPPSENAVLGRKHALVYGRAAMQETIEGVEFAVSAASFFQINSEMVAEVFTFLRPLVRGMPRIVDLYCGAGTFALFFAACGANVVGIEENPHAVREAERNAARNDATTKTKFRSGRVDTVLRSPIGAAMLAEADAVFLDPPRKGSDEATLATLVRNRVRRVWYLSCNPATLARDLAYLTRGGYRIGGVQPFDMFPQTGHIEALALLDRADLEPLDVALRQEAA